MVELRTYFRIAITLAVLLLSAYANGDLIDEAQEAATVDFAVESLYRSMLLDAELR